MTVPNELLRAHVTRVGFSLQLSKNQIAELVWLDYELSDPRSTRERLDANDTARLDHQHGRHLLTNGIASRAALMARGLVAYQAPTRSRNRGEALLGESMRDRYSITPAGRAVIDLLKMAGLWDEVCAELPWNKPPGQWTTFTVDDEVKHLRERLEQALAEVEEERGKTKAECKRADDADRARVRAEMNLGRLQERVKDVKDLFDAAGLVGSSAP